LDEILYGGDDIEDDLESMLLNPVASTIPKWRTFKLLRWVQLLNDWWIWMTFCMEVMTSNNSSTPYYLISYLKPLKNCRRLNF
jgi:hypothetical protein